MQFKIKCYFSLPKNILYYCIKYTKSHQLGCDVIKHILSLVVLGQVHQFQLLRRMSNILHHQSQSWTFQDMALYLFHILICIYTYALPALHPWTQSTIDQKYSRKTRVPALGVYRWFFLPFPPPTEHRHGISCYKWPINYYKWLVTDWKYRWGSHKWFVNSFYNEYWGILEF